MLLVCNLVLPFNFDGLSELIVDESLSLTCCWLGYFPTLRVIVLYAYFDLISIHVFLIVFKVVKHP